MPTFNYYECKICYQKTLDSEKTQKVKESYLVNAISFSEAETRIIKEMSPFITGEFQVTDIKISRYSEIFHSQETDADKYFKAKLVFVVLDEKSGKEKKTSTQVLVQAVSLEKAMEGIKEGMKGSMMDYAVATIQETPIMDVYHYSAE